MGYSEHDGFTAAQIGGGSAQGDDRSQTGSLGTGESQGSGEQQQPVADTKVPRFQERQCCAGGSPEHAARSERCSTQMEYADCQRCQKCDTPEQRTKKGLDTGESAPRRDQGATQSELGGGTSGVSDWLDSVATRLEAQQWPAGRGEEQLDWEPPRVADGIAYRAPRIKMIGNSCPPQQYAVVLSAIVNVDRMIQSCREEMIP